VVVVGGGNSAVQIAVELAVAANVTLATRAALKFTPQYILGRDIHFWARVSGLEQLPLGHWARLREINPVLDTGSYRTALAAGRPDRQRMFTSFTAEVHTSSTAGWPRPPTRMYLYRYQSGCGDD